MPNIIAGRRRGASLLSSTNKALRPTPAHTREAVFSSLQSMGIHWPDCHVLDAFAGTGALGLEAWSRGAQQITLIENHKEQYAILRKNVQKLNAGDACKTLYKSFPQALSGVTYRFHVVFLDPPYQSDLVNQSLSALHLQKNLTHKALIVIETEKNVEIEIPETYLILRDKNYGRTRSLIVSYEHDA